MNALWQALNDEAAISAEHLGIGATALGKANYAFRAYYAQAFFALSIGLERSAKLALVIDHALEHSGTFPTTKKIRAHGHALAELLDAADEIASRQVPSPTPSDRLPRSKIHQGIIEVLSDFASNITRYYNLDLITGSAGVRGRSAPLHEWYDKVITPVRNRHYSTRRRAEVETQARLIAEMMGPHASVRHLREDGQPLDNIFDSSVATGEWEAVTPYCRMYVLQVARFFSHLLSDLTHQAQLRGVHTVPCVSEHYAIFNNPDRYFRGRKNWSIYRR